MNFEYFHALFSSHVIPKIFRLRGNKIRKPEMTKTYFGRN